MIQEFPDRIEFRTGYRLSLQIADWTHLNSDLFFCQFPDHILMTSHGNPMSDSLCTNIHCICDIIHTSALAGMNRKGHTNLSCIFKQIHEL